MELRVLHSAYELLKRGEKINIAILGPRRIGKLNSSSKFKEEARGVIPYLNLQRIGSF
ncbi:hypothetical protein [Thermococcus chitonophagus]|uniref:hypothetical protein n=1 Tax=Thermococcus chitonophagus TaxID=54262 RepID=UPI001E3F8AA5|nr:hypothetical protein [Thermococcus chitonophagus]